MDYRITVVYRDASTRELYASTEADVVNLISQELRSTLRAPHHDHAATFHVTNLALQGKKA